MRESINKCLLMLGKLVLMQDYQVLENTECAYRKVKWQTLGILICTLIFFLFLKWKNATILSSWVTNTMSSVVESCLISTSVCSVIPWLGSVPQFKWFCLWRCKSSNIYRFLYGNWNTDFAFFYDEGKFPVVDFFLIQVKNNVLSPSSIGNRAVSSVILKMSVP